MSRSRRREGTRGGRRPLESLCIVVEGEVTEYEYLEGLRKLLGIPKERVRVIPGKHTDLKGMVTGMDAIRKGLASRGVTSVSEWWVLGDTEGRELDVDGLLRRAKSEGVTVAVNDPCVEVWLLMHFRDVRRPYLDAGEVIRDLREFIPDYDSPSKDPRFDKLKGHIPDAVARAKDRRREAIERSEPCSPWVDTDLIVRRVVALADPDRRSVLPGVDPLDAVPDGDLLLFARQASRVAG